MECQHPIKMWCGRWDFADGFVHESDIRTVSFGTLLFICQSMVRSCSVPRLIASVVFLRIEIWEDGIYVPRMTIRGTIGQQMVFFTGLYGIRHSDPMAQRWDRLLAVVSPKEESRSWHSSA